MIRCQLGELGRFKDWDRPDSCGVITYDIGEVHARDHFHTTPIGELFLSSGLCNEEKA